MHINVNIPQLLITPGSEYPVRQHRGHQLSVTCVAITDDEKTVFSGSKDCCIIKCKYYTAILTHIDSNRMTYNHCYVKKNCFKLETYEPFTAR